MLTTKVQKGEMFSDMPLLTKAPFNLSPLVDAAAEDMLPSLALSCQGRAKPLMCWLTLHTLKKPDE